MRIGVIGAGGVGGYFGAQLAAHGQDVVFVARGEHMAAIRSHGLQVHSDHAPVHIKHPQVTDSISQLGELDLVLIAVKLWDTEKVARQLAPHVGEQTIVLSLQNGVTKDDLLREHLPRESLVGAASYISAAIEAPGVIRHNGALARIVFGEFDGQRTPRVARLRNTLRASGVDATLSTSIEDVLWRKFVFLVGLSAVTAATRQPVGVIRDLPRTRELLHQAMGEVVHLARARGIDLPEKFADDQMAFIDTLPDDMSSSMLHDLEHGRRLELPWLSDSVAKMGAAAGVRTPTNLLLGAVLSPYLFGVNVPAQTSHRHSAGQRAVPR